MMDRSDYVSGFHTELAYLLAVEELADIEVPARAQYLRVIFSELCRITQPPRVDHRRRAWTPAR